MAVEINGIAHIQLDVNDPAKCAVLGEAQRRDRPIARQC